MKLIYLWIKKYYKINKQGFKFSANHEVNFKYDEASKKASITVEDKPAYNFYGKKISDITAIVGENGSGKTTLAKEIMSICSSINLVDKERQKYFTNGNSDEYVVIFEVNAEANEKKYVCYYWLDDIEIEDNDKIRFVNTEMGEKLQGEVFSQEREKHNFTTMYFTNTFDMNLINEKNGIAGWSSEFGEFTQREGSVASKVFTIISRSKERYGVEGGPFIIDKYATFMESNNKKVYINSIAQDFITLYNTASSEVKKLLDENIFKRIKFTIKKFADGIEDIRIPFYEMHSDELNMLFIQKIMEFQLVEALKSNDLQRQIYINTLCEMILFSNIWGEENIRQFINISLKKEVELAKKERRIIKLNNEMANKILNKLEEKACEEKNKKQIALITFVRKIVGTEDINKNLIKEFIETYSDENIKKSMWFKSLEHYLEVFDRIENREIVRKCKKEKCINFIKFIRKVVGIKDIDKNLSKDLGTGAHYYKFDVDIDNNELSKLYFEEMQEKYSVLLRNINFEYIPVSTGEMALVNLFSNIYENLLPKKDGETVLKNKDNVLLIIDELDVYLHPRWQQLILKKIIDWISAEKKFSNKFQIVVTSHSPIILSDFTSDRVIRLNNNSENVTKNADKKTFGANIGMLYYDNFFMEEGSIGEIAKATITEVIKYINGVDNQFENKEEVLYVINQIGEEMVRRKLLFDYNSKFQENNDSFKKLEELAHQIGIDKAIDILLKQEDGKKND